MKPAHPYRKGPRPDSYAPHLSTRGLFHAEGLPRLPKDWQRITDAEHEAYLRVWEEYDRTGTWVPRSTMERV